MAKKRDKARLAARIGADQAASAPAIDRWREEPLADPASFYAAHPECVVSGAMLDHLEPQIRLAVVRIDRLARQNQDRFEDLSSQIRLRIIEAATAWRRRDPASGEPVYDYLSQTDGYIVEHASGAVASHVRRERKIAEHLRLTSLDGVGAYADLSDEADGEVADPASMHEGDFSDAVAEGIDLDRFKALVRSRLSPAERSVFDLLVVGFTRAEVPRQMSVSRQTVHPHMKAIQSAARVAMARMEQPDARRPYMGLRRAPIASRLR